MGFAYYPPSSDDLALTKPQKILINKSVYYRLKIGKKSMSQNVLLLAAIDGWKFETGR